MSKYTEIVELLSAIPTITMRKSSTSAFTTQKPVWEMVSVLAHSDGRDKKQ